jgi:hypothetical protein
MVRDTRQDGVVVIDVDATVVTAHSDKEQASRRWKKTFGFHPLLAYVDHGVGGGGEPVAELLRPGACQDLCVSCHSLGLAEVGSESVGVGQGEGSEGLFPALDAGAFDEPVGGFALVAGDAFLVGSLPGAFVFDVADALATAA